MTDPTDIAERLAEAFDLGTPTGPVVAVRHVSQETWRLDTSSGSVLVKRFWRGPDLPWRESLDAAMRLEGQALEAGIDSPRPVQPRVAQFGAAAQIDGLGIFRAYPFVTHRPLSPDDDIADWLGDTLARIHQLDPLDHVPAPPWWYNQFPPARPAHWHEWLEQGAAQCRAWAPALKQHLHLVLDLSVRVTDAFAAAVPHVLTHRDIEPWNVLMTPSGRGWRPLLIDWDVAGPDSAPLETAYALASFAMYGRAEPDPAWLRRAADAYAAAGGQLPKPGPDLLVRMLGMRLAKISQGIRSDLEGSTPRSFERPAEAQTLEHIDGLAELTVKTDGWAALMPRG